MTSSPERQRPFVGVGVVVRRNGKVLVHKRKSAHGEGMWSLPGGHLEYGETFEECAAREVKEETSLSIANLRVGPFVSNIFPESGKHYITICVIADCVSGEAKVMEPEKSGEWVWVAWDAIPKPLFPPVQSLLKQGFDPFA